MFTVYQHKNKINSKIYIGITEKPPKVRWGKNGIGYRNSYFANAIQKYGWDNFEHIILFENLTKEEAEQKEIELIKSYDTTNHEKGYNIAKGGMVNSGYNLSDERKEHLSQINSGEKHPQFGSHRSQETREKISKSNKGRKFTEEHKKKLSLAKKGRKALNRKPVSQYDLNMNFIKRWDSLETVKIELGISKPNICRAIKEGKAAGGFKWTY